MADEKVLVVERKVFEELGAFEGLNFEAGRYLEALFGRGVAGFMDRSAAEVDPGYKQLIPYVLMECEGRWLSYVRGKRAGEGRLVGQRSMGIGGHVNPPDNLPLFDVDYRETYLAAVEREVMEEVEVGAAYVDRMVALLNDDRNEVGQVHLGVVHVWRLGAAKVAKREQMITQLGFLREEELVGVRGEMETWSQLCLDRLGELRAAAGREE